MTGIDTARESIELARRLAGAMDRPAFEALAREAGIPPLITEVDGSSLFCELVKPAARA